MLSKDFKEFIELLNENSVKYLVVGGYAVALHGHPRYTKDLDVWIELSPDNAVRILKALEKFGFGSLDLKPDDFLEGDQIIQLGYPPNRIDILTTLKDLQFEDCYKSRVQVEIQGLHINFIDIENLKKNKRATGRSQDLADAIWAGRFVEPRILEVLPAAYERFKMKEKCPKLFDLNPKQWIF